GRRRLWDPRLAAATGPVLSVSTPSWIVVAVTPGPVTTGAPRAASGSALVAPQAGASGRARASRPASLTTTDRRRRVGAGSRNIRISFDGGVLGGVALSWGDVRGGAPGGRRPPPPPTRETRSAYRVTDGGPPATAPGGTP